MDIKYINPFINSTTNVFEDFFKVSPVVQKPYIVRSNEDHEWDVSAIIGIAGETRGAVVISFTEDLATLLTSKLVGRQITTIDDDVVDTIGEIVNIIAGNAKKGLEEYRLMISLPSIIKGKNHQIAWPVKNLPIVGIPFKTDFGPFTLSVGLENIITEG
ncbi:MAG: chemotaxis protein CheX [Spirochaetaceae bacterium]|nr:MAG: chemotaxis protein CheX [Spirochaetaceae bacterium]